MFTSQFKCISEAYYSNPREFWITFIARTGKFHRLLESLYYRHRLSQESVGGSCEVDNLGGLAPVSLL